MKVWKFLIIIQYLSMMMANYFQKEVHLYIQLIRIKSPPLILIQQIILLSLWEENEKTKIMNMKKIYSIPMPLMMIAILTMKIYPDPKLMSRIAKKSRKNTMLMRLMKIMFSKLTSKKNKKRLILHMKLEKENLKMLHTW